MNLKYSTTIFPSDLRSASQISRQSQISNLLHFHLTLISSATAQLFCNLHYVPPGAPQLPRHGRLAGRRCIALARRGSRLRRGLGALLGSRSPALLAVLAAHGVAALLGGAHTLLAAALARRRLPRLVASPSPSSPSRGPIAFPKFNQIYSTEFN